MTAANETAHLMDSIYRNQRHIYDLTRKYYLLGRDHLIANLAPPKGGTVLELGCGTGRNLIAAARKYPGVQFHGLDISHQMLATAADNIERAGCSDRIKLVQGDASDPASVAGLGVETYDRVFYSYTLSMMPVWREALATGLSNLSADGKLVVGDFGQQEGLPDCFRALLLRWLGKFHVSPRKELEDELKALAGYCGAPISVRSLYRGYAIYAELRRG